MSNNINTNIYLFTKDHIIKMHNFEARSAALANNNYYCDLSSTVSGFQPLMKVSGVISEDE